MPALPSTGASALAGLGFGKGLREGDVSADAVGGVVVGGTGYGTGFGSAGGSASGIMPLSFLSATRSRAAAPASNESYGCQPDNDYRTVAVEPLSTFSVDVDTASYTNIRRFIAGGHLPPRDAVRIEEMINYFPYRYAPPPAARTDNDAPSAVNAAPFAAQLDVASAPWAPAHRLVRIGLKGRELTSASRPAANLVFLLDVSGSMNSANKLPLVKDSLRLLVERLRPDDRVAIVTYAGGSGLALPSTPASQKREILSALENLSASGSTNGAMGIHLAYDIAKANFATDGLNRVILCTDGDFNVGVTNRDELVRLITEKARSRVFLSVFGFGMGNLKDNTLESLADKGNGAYGYIDTRREAEKVFVEQAEGTLATIAKDVKVQVEFNPAHVTAYRLIGYENRLLKKEDFNNDTVDAGDIGAGHTVTALYEILPVGVDWSTVMPVVDALKYQKTKAKPVDVVSREMLTVKIRYKAPEGDVSRRQEFPLIDTGADFPKADGEFQFAAAVAAWGMLLRDSPHKGSATFDQVINWAESGLGEDTSGYRAEFIQLVRRSAELLK
jgi:Ca-activated chloride channel family protein